LPICIFCNSEATVADGGKLVICRQCGQYRLVEGLAAELTNESDWPELQSDLARAVRWRFYQGEPVTISNVTSARWLVEKLKEFEEGPEERERQAVDALVSTGPVENPWDRPIANLGGALGLPSDESRAFAEKLQAGNIVRIVDCKPSWTALDTQPLSPRLKEWVRCEEEG
jgi:hypothetical protein